MRPAPPLCPCAGRDQVLHDGRFTGDNCCTAHALGSAAAVDEIHAELLPEDRVRAVDQLRSRGATAMVGDGINDAPALATADVGLAMGAMGSDVLEVLPHARCAGRIMRQNLVLSGLIIGVLIPLAASGALGLATVVATHELAGDVVIANGVRGGQRRYAFASHGAPLSDTAEDRQETTLGCQGACCAEVTTVSLSRRH